MIMMSQRIKLRARAAGPIGGLGLALFAATFMLAGCGASGPPLPTVEYVDLARYAGRWYEIARYPNSFERNCAGVTADYTPLPNGEIEVLNTCRKFTIDGRLESAKGTARVVDTETNAKLKVRFFGPFEGDYWIIGLDDEDYQYAVVGEPGRRFLWILSRTPQMDPEVYDSIIDLLPELGYDPGELELVVQYESSAP
jgi:apolipoprotein D and lipocalin family protein